MAPRGTGRAMPSKGAGSNSSTWDSARQLLGKLRQAKLFTAFQAWKALSEFDATVKATEQAIGTHEAVLRKAPSQRSPKEVEALAQLLQQIAVYKALPRSVLLFLATYARVLFVWGACELPASAQEQAALFSIISGGMTCVVGEASDPVLRCIVRQAADQLLEVHDSLQSAAASPKPGARAASPIAAASAVHSSTTPPTASQASLPATFDLLRPYLGPTIPNVERFAVPECCSRVWHTVTSMIHDGHMPTRAQAETMLRRLGVITGGREGRSSTYGGARTSYAGGGQLCMSHAGGVQFSLSGTPHANFPGLQLDKPRPSNSGATAAQTQASPYAGVTLLALGAGDSFSGKDLDCRAESGQSEASTVEFPPRTLAAVPKANSLTALLVISRAVYRHAMQLVREVMVEQAVTRCCQLPFLRHTPLRELFRLSHHLTLTTYKEEETLLHQDKEAPHIYFLLEGSVDVIMDVPLQPNAHTLAAWSKLDSAIQPSARSHSPDDASIHRDRQSSLVLLGGTVGMLGTTSSLPGNAAESTTKSRATSVAGKREATPEGPKQRVLLATKEAPACLGDEALRDDKVMPVSVVVSSPQAVCLWTTQQRFAVSLDGLTLRLFQKLLPQLTLPWLLQQKLVKPEDMHGAEYCRTSMIHSTWHPSKVPTALKRPGAGALAHTSTPSVPWNFPGMGGFFGTVPSLNSMEASNMQEAQREGASWQCGSPTNASQHLQRTSKSVQANDEQASPSLPSGINSSWLKGIAVTESIAMLQRMVMDVEDSRAGSLPSSPKKQPFFTAPNMQGASRRPDVVDMREIVVQSVNQRKSSEVMSAACIGYISVSVLPGQMGGTLDEVAPVLDDASNAWSQLAHQNRCTLLRWSNREYYVYGETSGGTCTVRLLSDLMLGMLAAFDQHIADAPAHHHVCHAGLATGSVYVTIDNGLVTSIGGPGVDACVALCEAAKEEWPADSSIMITDAAMQAVSRTHITAFAGQGYRLLRSRQLPFNTPLETLLGQEPAAKPAAPSPTGRQGFLEGFRVSRQRLLEGSSPNSQDSIKMVHVAHFAGSSQVVALQDGLLMQTGVAAQPPIRAAGSTPAAHKQMHDTAASHSAPSSPCTAGMLRRGKQGTLKPLRVSNMAKGVPACEAADGSGCRPYRSTREQRVHQVRGQHARVAAEWQGRLGTAPILSSRLGVMREAVGCRTVIEVRDQLRAELRQLGRDCPASDDFSHIPHSKFRSGQQQQQQQQTSPGAGHHQPLPTLLHIPSPCPRDSTDEDSSCFLTQVQSDLGLTRQDVHGSNISTAGLLPLTAAVQAPHSFSHLMRPSPFLVATLEPLPPTPCSNLRPDPQSRSVVQYTSDGGRSPAAAVAAANGRWSTQYNAVQQYNAAQQYTGSDGGGDDGQGQREGFRKQQVASLGCDPDSPPSNSHSPCCNTDGHTTQVERSSVRAAHAFVRGLHAGQVQVSFSTAGLPKLPLMHGLTQLDSLASSFNQLRRLSRTWVAALHGHLRILCCTHSEVRQLPDDLGSMLPSLTELNLAQNELTQLPESISLMVKLRCLSVEHNQVSQVPAGICRLDGMQQLHLGHNLLTQLPDDWTHMPALTLLHVHNNQLQALPPSITCLVGLTSLDASCNELTTLPPRCLEALSNLHSLKLAYNKLCSCQQIHGAWADQSHFNDERAYQREHTPLRACPSYAALQQAQARTTSFARRSLASAPSFMHSLRQTEHFQQFLHSFRSQCSLHSQHSLHSQYSRRSQFSQRAGSILGLGGNKTDPGIVGLGSSPHNSQLGVVDTADSSSSPTKLGVRRSSTCPRLGQPTGPPAGALHHKLTPAESKTGAIEPTHPASGTCAGRVSTPNQHCTPAALAPTGRADREGLTESPAPNSLQQECRADSAGSGMALKGGILQNTSRGITPGSAERPRSQHAKLRVVLPDEDKPLFPMPALQSKLPPALQPVLDRVLDGLGVADDLTVQAECSSEDSLLDEEQQPAGCPETPHGDGASTKAAVLLPCLHVLDIQGNQLVGVPDWLPSSLTHLNLSRNSITRVPAWLPDRLQNLRLLELHANQLRDLPAELKPLLTRLKLLTLQDNPATSPEALEAVSETSPNGVPSSEVRQYLGPRVENISWAWELIRAARYNNRKAKSLGTGPHTTCNTPVADEHLEGASNTSFNSSSRPASSKPGAGVPALRQASQAGYADNPASCSPLKAVPSQGISVVASSVSLAADLA